MKFYELQNSTFAFKAKNGACATIIGRGYELHIIAQGEKRESREIYVEFTKGMGTILVDEPTRIVGELPSREYFEVNLPADKRDVVANFPRSHRKSLSNVLQNQVSLTGPDGI